MRIIFSVRPTSHGSHLGKHVRSSCEQRLTFAVNRPFHASMGIMTIRLILHLHKAMHRLQNMSNPGSAIYMSDRTGPITFRVEHDAGSDDEDDEDDDEDEDELLHNHGEVLEITIAAPTMRQRSIDIDNDTVR